MVATSSAVTRGYGFLRAPARRSAEVLRTGARCRARRGRACRSTRAVERTRSRWRCPIVHWKSSCSRSCPSSTRPKVTQQELGSVQGQTDFYGDPRLSTPPPMRWPSSCALSGEGESATDLMWLGARLFAGHLPRAHMTSHSALRTGLHRDGGTRCRQKIRSELGELPDAGALPRAYGQAMKTEEETRPL